ncbi:hypothetical protein D8674_031103 [Pyrus ussuriensis x Pyrus communis]|uniref:Uncharacterized protein n=1 Tax=Pyrus ussuriensis x Pyrus communis TaxID=2448454 RepID=A0A5N5EYT0_9ROSA|nr:hypothetical protein D8674_031103 [Pyrus ussuriensis x Pyrus communis]
MAETMAAGAAVLFTQEVSCSAMEVQLTRRCSGDDAVVIVNALQAADAAALSGEFWSFSHLKVTFGRRKTKKFSIGVVPTIV